MFVYTCDMFCCFWPKNIIPEEHQPSTHAPSRRRGAGSRAGRRRCRKGPRPARSQERATGCTLDRNDRGRGQQMRTQTCSDACECRCVSTTLVSRIYTTIHHQDIAATAYSNVERPAETERACSSTGPTKSPAYPSTATASTNAGTIATQARARRHARMCARPTEAADTKRTRPQGEGTS
jgi:hypothetical protein